MRNLRAVVVIPSFHDFYATPRRHTGLGAMIVCTILERYGVAWKYLHFPATDPAGRVVPLPDFLRHLRDFILPDERGRVSFFTGYRRFGPPHTTCAATLLAENPHMVFISCFAFQYVDDSAALARELRDGGFEGPIIAGGAGVCAAPDRLLRNGCVDFVLTGEAEVSLPPLLAALKRSSGSPFSQRTARSVLSEIRWKTPRRTATPCEIEVPLSVGTDPDGTTRISTSLSRGCPRSCFFCSAFLCHGRDYRTVELERFEAALDSLVTKLRGADLSRVCFNFEDDNITASPEYFIAVLHSVRRRFPRVRFIAENGLDFRFLDAEFVRRLVRLGFCRFDLSLGAVPDQTKRYRVPERFRSIAGAITGMGVPCVGYFICGCPGDTPDGIVDTLVQLASLPLRVGISLFYPVPGLPGFEDPARFDPVPSHLTCGSAAYPWTGNLTTGELVTAFRLSRVVNLCKEEDRTVQEEALLRRILADGRLYTFRRRRRHTVLAPVPGMNGEMCRRFAEGIATGGVPRPFA